MKQTKQTILWCTAALLVFVGTAYGETNFGTNDKYIAQAQAQVIQAALALGMTADLRIDDIETGKIYRGRGETVSMPLLISGQPDSEVVLVGVCDQDCGDIDLVVFDGDGNQVAVDRDYDDHAIVTIAARIPAFYAAWVSIPDEACSAYRCSYGVGAFSRDGSASFGTARTASQVELADLSARSLAAAMGSLLESPDLLEPTPPGSSELPPQNTPGSEESQGTAACTIGDGPQTVKFSDGSSYTGEFIACSPQSGNATYVSPSGETFTGYFQAEGNGVTLQQGDTKLTLWLETQAVSF